MTVSSEDEIERLRGIGRTVARVLNTMGAALEPGMTTAELDAIGREVLERRGAQTHAQIQPREQLAITTGELLVDIEPPASVRVFLTFQLVYRLYEIARRLSASADTPSLEDDHADRPSNRQPFAFRGAIVAGLIEGGHKRRRDPARIEQAG